jgi:hypothetical protein
VYYIKDAKIRRMTEYDGAPCAEVGVLPGAVGDSALLVYIVEDRREEGYEIVRILTNDAILPPIGLIIICMMPSRMLRSVALPAAS